MRDPEQGALAPARRGGTWSRRPALPSPRRLAYAVPVLHLDKALLSLASALALAVLAGPGLTACGSPPDTKMVAHKEEGVPANSASEERLAAGDRTATSSSSRVPEDPSRPVTTPVGGDASGGSASSGGATAMPVPVGGSAPAEKLGKDGKPLKAGKEPKGASGPKASKAECKQLFDKYIDLTVGTDSRFEGIPPEMIAQLKQSALAQAQQEKGDPCSTQDVTRSQYNCAMSSTSTGAWQACMK
ncbi:MAG: hypothetical protein JWP97_3780 [Labilithrix sp.]|nr:hypothetical protein [Labilithrix sp.]